MRHCYAYGTLMRFHILLCIWTWMIYVEFTQQLGHIHRVSSVWSNHVSINTTTWGEVAISRDVSLLHLVLNPHTFRFTTFMLLQYVRCPSVLLPSKACLLSYGCRRIDQNRACTVPDGTNGRSIANCAIMIKF